MLTKIIDALIAAGGTMDQVRAVVAAVQAHDAEQAQRQAEADQKRIIERRANAAERQRRSRLSRHVTRDMA